MKKHTMSFVAGLLTGAMLFGGGVAYAAGVMAEYAPQQAYVDGVPVQMNAYNIGGNNYVKLRDIGQMVGFNVYWDGRAVQIDSNAPYTGEAPAQGNASIRVGCSKGSTLKEGVTSTLIIAPSRSDYTVTSSNPAVAHVAEVLGHWTINTKAPGATVITVTAPDGKTGSVSITVEPSASTNGNAGSNNLNANMEIRLEMIRLINQTRVAYGVPELPVDDALMNAAQTMSDKQYSWHNSKEECEAALAFGYPHGFGSNLTAFTGVGSADIAQHAVANWISSPGHFETMIDAGGGSLGVGITENDRGATFCFMFIGLPGTHNPYE